MAKFRGMIGFATEQVEDPPDSGIWVENVIAHKHTGDIVRNSRKLEEGDQVNDNVSVGNSISIVADAYAREHFFAIRYVDWAGTLWKVSNVDVESPRLILRLGGVYHGRVAETPAPSNP